MFVIFEWVLNPLDTGSKLNVHKTLRPGPLLNFLCTFLMTMVQSTSFAYGESYSKRLKTIETLEKGVKYVQS